MANPETDRCIWSDEVYLGTNSDHLCRTQWCRPSEHPESRLKKRWPTARVHIWGAIGINFRLLIIFTKAKKGEDDDDGKPFTLNGHTYKTKVLHKIVPLVVARQGIFMQDGARPHVKKECLRYLRSKNARYFDDWPSHSPRMNVIENLWSWLAQKISERMPQNLDELVAAITEEFAAFPVSAINHLVRQWPERLKECIEKKGFL
jgi:transposase